MRVFAGTGNNHVAAQPQQGFKRHDKGQVGAALHFPVGEQRFIVDEPAAVGYPRGFAFNYGVGGNLHAFPHFKRLVVPESERLNPQEVAADLKQAIDKAQIIGCR